MRERESEREEVLGPGRIVRPTKDTHYLFAEIFSRWQEGGRGVTLRSSCGRMASTVRTVLDVSTPGIHVVARSGSEKGVCVRRTSYTVVL